MNLPLSFVLAHSLRSRQDHWFQLLRLPQDLLVLNSFLYAEKKITTSQEPNFIYPHHKTMAWKNNNWKLNKSIPY
jgi:hypothetical protein